MVPLILIISEHLELFLLLKHILQTDGFAAAFATNVQETMGLILAGPPQAVILDCQKESELAPEVYVSLMADRTARAIPVVALIGADAQAQHLKLVRAGLNEFLTRPVAPAKLIDFLQSVTPGRDPEAGVPAQPQVQDPAAPTRLRHGEMEICLETYRVSRNGVGIHLGPTEFRLLRHLMTRPGQPFTREDLIAAVWPPGVFVDPRTIDVHIARLRRSQKAVADKQVIRTVRAVGYALELCDGTARAE